MTKKKKKKKNTEKKNWKETKRFTQKQLVSAPNTPSFKQFFMAKTYIYNCGQNLWNNVKKSNKIGQDDEEGKLGTRLCFHPFSRFSSIFTYFLRCLSCKSFGNLCNYTLYNVFWTRYHVPLYLWWVYQNPEMFRDFMSAIVV